MASEDYFRGGSSLTPKPHEVKIDPQTGLLRMTHGISVFNRPNNLEQFGGPHRVTELPRGLKIIQRGRDPRHFEIVPENPMTMQDYEHLLQQIVLIPVSQV